MDLESEQRSMSRNWIRSFLEIFSAKQKECGACGAHFECASLSKPCWCGKVEAEPGRIGRAKIALYRLFVSELLERSSEGKPPPQPKACLRNNPAKRGGEVAQSFASQKLCGFSSKPGSLLGRKQYSVDPKNRMVVLGDRSVPLYSHTRPRPIFRPFHQSRAHRISDECM